MDRVIAADGAKHDVQSLFSDLQDYIAEGVSETLANGFITNFGVCAALGSDGNILSSDTTLKCSLNGTAPNYTDTTAIIVQPGKVITEDMQYMNVKTTQTVPLGVNYADGNLHTLYITANPVYSGYTAVLNGFKYQAGQNTTPTREIYNGGFTFSWDVVASGQTGIKLAGIVKTSGLAIFDYRSGNVVTLDSSTFDSDAVRKSWTGTQTLVGTLNAAALQVNGNNVETVGTTPLAPPSFVINNVTPYTSIPYIPASITPPSLSPIYSYDLVPLNVTEGLTSSQLNLQLYWGIVFEGSTHSGDLYGNTLTVYGMTYSTPTAPTTGALANYYIYFYSINKTYKVNTITLGDSSSNSFITFLNLDGSTPNFSSHTPINDTAFPGLFIIFSYAEKYIVSATPYNGLVPDTTITKEWVFTQHITEADSNNGIPITVMAGNINVDVGQKYIITVRATNGTQISNSVGLTSNTWTSYFGLSNGYVALIPPVKDTGGSPTPSFACAATALGFTVSISATGDWTAATSFEICWRDTQYDIKFDAPNYNRKVIYNTSVPTDIIVPSSLPQNVIVRALKGGQILGALPQQTVSGIGTTGGYNLPYVVSNFNINAVNSISATALTGTATAAMYRVSVYMDTNSTPPGTAGTVVCTIKWSGTLGVSAVNTATLQTASDGSFVQGTYYMHHQATAGASITYATTASGGNSYVYQLQITVEKVG